MDSIINCVNHYIVYNKSKLIQAFIVPKIVYNVSRFKVYKIRMKKGTKNEYNKR